LTGTGGKSFLLFISGGGKCESGADRG